MPILLMRDRAAEASVPMPSVPAMTRRARLLTHGIVVAVLLTLAAAPVDAGDETCFPIEVDWFSPSGVAGCSLDGPTEGVASVYGGESAAANWCVWPFKDCSSVTVQSHQTGIVITVPVAMYCDCWWFSDRRLVDLTFSQVEALGLNPEAGIFEVTVTPFRGAASSITLPDTALPCDNTGDVRRVRDSAADAQSHRLPTVPGIRCYPSVVSGTLGIHRGIDR